MNAGACMGRFLGKAGLKARPGQKKSKTAAWGDREQRGQDCWAMTADMLTHQKMSRSSSKGPASPSTGLSVRHGSQLCCLSDTRAGLWQPRTCGVYNIYAAVYRAGKHQLSRPLTTPFHVSARHPASTSHLTQHSLVEEKMWSGLLPVNYVKCLPCWWQIAQVSPLNMFKPYNKISVCWRPSASLAVWERGGVTHCLPRLEPSFPHFWVGDEASLYFRFLLKTARNWMRPLELPMSAGWYGCVRATFAFPQSYDAMAVGRVSSLPALRWCSSAAPAPELVPTWEGGQSSSSHASHLSMTHCANVPSLLLFASGKDDFHHPATLIRVPALSPSQVLGTGLVFCLAIPGLTFHFHLSVSSSPTSCLLVLFLFQRI